MSIPLMTPQNYKLPIVVLYVLCCLFSVHGQDSTTPLNALCSAADVLDYAKTAAVKIMAAHPEGGAGSHWGDSYVGPLSQVDRKTILTAIDQVPTGGGSDWRQSRVEYFLLTGALNKFATAGDIPMLLQADTIDSLRAISMKKMADDPQVSAFLNTTLQGYQTTPPSDTDKTTFMVIFLANQSHDPKVNPVLADTMSKAAADPTASRNYLRMLADSPLRTKNQSSNILALVPALKARAASPPHP